LTLGTEQKKDFLQRGFSRRSFGRIATMLAAGSTLPFYNESVLAQEIDTRTLPPGAVKIDTNENPLGPCPEALEAMNAMLKDGGRYHFDLPSAFHKTLAASEQLKPNYIQAFPGSSMPLHWAVLAFTSPTRAYVTGDPGYEAGDKAAEFVGAKVVRVPLAKDYSHDVKGMVAAAPSGGLYYICNPNNPTGTMTSRADIDWLVANKPAGSIVLLDEAYLHFSGVHGNTDLVAADKDVIILRTFSKLYGMAGLRAGAAIGRPDLLGKIRAYGNLWCPTTSMAGAIASLGVKDLVAKRRKITKDTREDVFAFLDKNKFSYVPSVSNKFMLDVKRPGKEITAALRKENVYIGRSWPAWPTHVRVSIGTQEEMNKFKTAFLKVMA
jgi:histidinol-phosphate/aromatic aminotransferase/cobyric acid decarboxylase-like protein